MSQINDLYSYFSNKGWQWKASDGSVENHIKKLGRKGLAEEFKVDPSFRSLVCPYFETLGELQLRARVVNSLEGLVSVAFGIPAVGLMDLVIGAIADACGYKTIGDQLLEMAPIFVAIGGIVGLGLGLAALGK